ncbi:MAG: hypothetical protein JO301_15410 [Chitinophagaceae bacterium]|nr:hypothetical protein [Chitinophagaceae bacterium]
MDANDEQLNVEKIDSGSTSPKVSGFQMLLYLPLMAAMCWGLSNRSGAVIYRNTFYIAIPLFTLVSIVYVRAWIKGGYKKPTWWEILFIVASPFVIYGASIFYYGMGAGIKDAYMWITSSAIPKERAIFLSIITTLFLGVFLWYFRLKRRALYGLTETMIGLTVAALRASSEKEDNLNSPEFYLALLTAAIYLVVRGFDNIHQGLTKDPIDPWGTKIFKILKAKRFDI